MRSGEFGAFRRCSKGIAPESDSKGIAMRKPDPIGRRRGAAAVTLALAVSALAVSLGAVSLSAAGSAFAADDEEEVPLDTKILRQVLKDWGLRRTDEPGIEYRERAPLVVPPSRNLPKPQDEAASTKTPAWPNDPDVKRRKQEAAAEKARLKGGYSAEEQARALRPSELDQAGAKASDGSSTPAARTAEDTARPLAASELGSKNVFGKLFSSFAPAKAETAPFTGEPKRSSMTAPPAGYQTPSPNQPYGLGPAKDNYAVPKAEDQAVGSAQQR
jgi:hypothetical protein